jgi:putative Holliday junction resolvase
MQQHDVVGVVVGLPLESDGTEAAPAQAARALAADVTKHSGLPVEFIDERMTTARVLQAVREMGGSTRGRKAEIDALAATLVLQQYLDARRGSAT